MSMAFAAALSRASGLLPADSSQTTWYLQNQMWKVTKLYTHMIVDSDVADNISRHSSILPTYWHPAEAWRPIQHLGWRFFWAIAEDYNDVVVEGIAPVETWLYPMLREAVLILIMLAMLVKLSLVLWLVSTGSIVGLRFWLLHNIITEAHKVFTWNLRLTWFLWRKYKTLRFIFFDCSVIGAWDEVAILAKLGGLITRFCVIWSLNSRARLKRWQRRLK